MAIPDTREIAVYVQSDVFSVATLTLRLSGVPGGTSTFTIGENVAPSFVKVPVLPQRVSGGVDYFTVGIRASENGGPLSGGYHELKPPSSYSDNHPEYDPGDQSDTEIAYFSGSACTSGAQLLSDTTPGPEPPFTATGTSTAAYLVVVRWSGPPAQAGPTLREDRGGPRR